MRRILLLFFGPDGDSFTRGVTFVHNDSRIMIKGVFAGFLADDKAHTEIACLKGASGGMGELGRSGLGRWWVSRVTCGWF